MKLEDCGASEDSMEYGNTPVHVLLQDIKSLDGMTLLCESGAERVALAVVQSTCVHRLLGDTMKPVGGEESTPSVLRTPMQTVW
jgi:hypothetical protein